MDQLKSLHKDIEALRAEIDKTGKAVRKLMHHEGFSGGINPHGCDFGESKANIMLGFRHLEDARMRLGKAIQAIDGGVSCYDKDTWEARGKDFVFMTGAEVYRVRFTKGDGFWMHFKHTDDHWVTMRPVLEADAKSFFNHRVHLDHERLYEFGVPFTREGEK